MPAIPATWLVGSVEGLAAQAVSVNGGADTDVCPAGNWYLRHPLAALSLITQLDDALTAVLGTALVRVRPDRRVELSSLAPFTLSWSSPALPGLLGFGAGPLPVSDVHVAPGISPLLFSAGWPATTPVGEGQAGYPVEDEHTQISADGTIVDSEFHNVQTHNEFAWRHVTAARVRRSDQTTTLLQGGTWHRFREVVLRPNFRWQAYEEVTEDSDGAGVLSWPTPLGTYKRRKLPKGVYGRDIRNANTRWSLEVEAIAQGEYPPNA